MRYEMFVDK